MLPQETGTERFQKGLRHERGETTAITSFSPSFPHATHSSLFHYIQATLKNQRPPTYIYIVTNPLKSSPSLPFFVSLSLSHYHFLSPCLSFFLFLSLFTLCEPVRLSNTYSFCSHPPSVPLLRVFCMNRTTVMIVLPSWVEMASARRAFFSGKLLYHSRTTGCQEWQGQTN